MPERFDWNHKAPNVHFYPLRPELVESTYLLYQVSRSNVLHIHYVYLTHKKYQDHAYTIYCCPIQLLLQLFVHNNVLVLAGFHLEFRFGVEGGVAVSRTVSTPPPITIDINFWGVTEALF